MASESTPCSELPDSTGFYWWRETDRHEWRMIHVISYGDDNPETFGTYDVQHGRWRGRSLRNWRKWEPIGEWSPVYPPNAKHDAAR